MLSASRSMSRPDSSVASDLQNDTVRRLSGGGALTLEPPRPEVRRRTAPAELLYAPNVRFCITKTSERDIFLSSWLRLRPLRRIPLGPPLNFRYAAGSSVARARGYG